MPMQLTMAYTYWRSDRHEQEAVFDLFSRKVWFSLSFHHLIPLCLRKNPFQGEFCVCAGLDEVCAVTKYPVLPP